MKRIQSYLLALAVLTPAAALEAQTDPVTFYDYTDTLVVEADRIVRLPRLASVATKLPLPLRETPASISVVTKSMFDNQAGVIMSDALTNISGINVQSNFGVHDYFLIRGFDSISNGMVMTDGAIEPEATFYNLYNIERVEVLKGPSAFLYGGNPLSGTVNLVRKQPVFRNFASGRGSFGRFNTFRGMVDVGAGSLENGLAFRLNGMWQESENYRDDKSNDHAAINPSFTWRPGLKTAVTANVEYVDNSYKPDSGLPLLFGAPGTAPSIPDVPRTRSYQSPFDRSDQTTYRARVDATHQFSDRVSIRNKAYFVDLEWLSRGTLLLGAFPDQTGNVGVFRTLQDLADRQKMYGNQLEVLVQLGEDRVKNTILAGIEISRFDDVFTLNVADLTPMALQNPIEGTSDPNQLLYLPFATADASTRVIAPYFMNQLSLGGAVTVFAGGRYDVIDYDDTRSDFDFQTFQPMPGMTTREYRKFSPMGGVSYSPGNNVTVYANAGMAFAPPSSLVQGDAKPEESRQIELGFKLEALDGDVIATSSIYSLEKDNIGIPDATGITQQNGSQRSRGIEIEVMAQPFRRFFSMISYAYTDAELTEFRSLVRLDAQNVAIVDYAGNRSAFAPRHIFNLWATKELQNGFGFGGGARYLSDQYISEANQFEIASALTFDAIVFYRYGNWRWTLNVKNLTNTEYEQRGFGATSVIPAHPFSIYGGAEFSL